MIMMHAENGSAIDVLVAQALAEGKTDPKYHSLTRPWETEAEAVNRAIMLARMTGAPLYIVHMSAKQAVEVLQKHKDEGWNVFGETCPQYLLLDDSVYDKPDFEGAAYVMSPPIRPKGHQEVLWNALSNGAIQHVATDHCPFRQADQKTMGRDDFRKIPNGAAGIEDRLTLLYTYGVATGRISLQQFVDVTSTQAAKIFNLYPRKGCIAPGADADLVLYDPSGTGRISAKTHHQNVDRNIFEGFETKGKVATTIVAGRVQWHDGDLRVERGAGRYLKRTNVNA
jgi:dihydropyrimidinase